MPANGLQQGESGPIPKMLAGAGKGHDKSKTGNCAIYFHTTLFLHFRDSAGIVRWDPQLTAAEGKSPCQYTRRENSCERQSLCTIVGSQPRPWENKLKGLENTLTMFLVATALSTCHQLTPNNFDPAVIIPKL